MGYLFLAACSIAISVLLWFASERPNLVAEHRAIRNHLIEFMRVWLALSVFYIFQAFLEPLPSVIPAWSRNCLVGYLSPLFLWHFCVALTLGFGNIWLRRAGLELEISELPQNREKLVLPLETLGTSQRGVKWCTEEGILYGFLAALLLLGFVPSLASSRIALSVVYSFQILATSVLFLRLGLAYRSILGSQLLFVLSILYALLQLPYGLLVPAGTFSSYEFPLGLLKVSHGLALAAICLSYARRQGDQIEAPTAGSLRRLAKRLQGRATLRGIMQCMVFSALAMLALLLLGGAYSCALSYLRDQGYRELQLLPARLLFSLVLLLCWQVCGYFVLAKLRFRVNWADHRELLHHFKVTVQEPAASVPGIELVSIELAERVAPVVEQQTQVILLHGLFSSGAAAWGLLPLVLLREGPATCVRSLTYSHGLFTRRRALDQITRDVATKIGSLISDFPGKTVLIGHSLGGVIALKVLPELIRNRSGGPANGLYHVGIVGAPLLGSSFAKVLFPWPWSRMLGRHSRLLEETLRDALSVIPPVGSAADGEILFPSLTFVYGSRDSVAGEFVQFAAFHGEKIRAPAFHGLGLVFQETQELARVYHRMLSTPPRAVALARAIGGGILANAQFNASGVFIFSESLRVASAQFIGALQEDRLLEAEQESLEQRLRKLYTGIQKGRVNWGEYWQQLEDEVSRAATPRVFVKNWSESHVLLLYANRFAGFFAIMPRDGLVLGGETRNAFRSPHLGPVSSAIMTAFRDLDPAAVGAVVFEGCEHEMQIRAQSFTVNRASFTTLIDSRGTYYGLYAFDGTVGAGGGVDQLYVHIGAPGQPLNMEELAFACYDEVSNSQLFAELVELGKNCWLCRLKLGSRLGGGQEVRLRLSFRRQHCVNLLHGFELFRLEPVLAVGARLCIRLLLPGRVFALDAFKVREGKMEILTPRRSEDALERRYVYSLEDEVGIDDQAIGVRFAVDTVTAERRRLRDMVTIGQARREDLVKIAGMESLLSVRVPASIDDLSSRLQTFPDGVLVARIGDEVIGYIEFVRWGREVVPKFLDLRQIHSHHEADGRFAFIWFLGVLPAFRGRGIGRRLVSEVVSWSESRGIRRLQIVTQPSMRGYFEDIGFKKIKDIDEYMPDMPGAFMSRAVVV